MARLSGRRRQSPERGRSTTKIISPDDDLQALWQVSPFISHSNLAFTHESTAINLGCSTANSVNCGRQSVHLEDFAQEDAKQRETAIYHLVPAFGHWKCIRDASNYSYWSCTALFSVPIHPGMWAFKSTSF